jgi:hypothetical protein
LLLALAGCARDVNGGIVTNPYPNSVRLSFSTRDAFSPNDWYYMVFNYTQQGTGLDISPFDKISGVDRGRNWQLYVAYHPASGSEPQRLVTLQRPALPTNLPTAAGPADAAVADFGGDAQPDIAVACERAGVVQVAVAAVSSNLLDPVFYESPVDIYTGTAPKYLFARDWDADGAPDLVVVDSGSGATPASVRLLTRTDALTFSPGTAVSLTGRPVDAKLALLRGGSNPDLVVATAGPGDQNQLEVLLNDGSGNFTHGATVPMPAAVREIAAGNLDDNTNVDLAAGVATGGGAECIRILLGDGAGGLAPGPTRSLAGNLLGLTIGEMNGTLDDIVATFTDGTSGAGSVAAFVRNQASPDLATAPIVGTTDGGAGYVISEEFGNDNRRDAAFLDPAGKRLIIMRGERDDDPQSPLPGGFVWSDDPIRYPTGTGPTRLLTANLNADSTLDLIALNSSDEADGNSISLYFGLGKYNYSNADIYWTDDPPQELQVQPWYIEHQIGPNSFALTLDPALFFDLARQEPSDFYVQFMTGTTGIDLISNPGPTQVGEIRDLLSSPVQVRMEVGLTNDNQQSPLANNNSPPIAAEDVVDWNFEVF